MTLTNIDATNSFNEDSFTSDDDVVAIDADNSFNSSDDDNVVAIRDDDTFIEDNDVVLENSFNETEAPDGSLAAVSPPSQLPAEPAEAGRRGTGGRRTAGRAGGPVDETAARRARQPRNRAVEEPPLDEAAARGPRRRADRPGRATRPTPCRSDRIPEEQP